MKKILFILFILPACMFFTKTQAQIKSQVPAHVGFQNNKLFNYQFRVVTTVESIVPGGIGRSRMIINNPAKIEEDTTRTRSNHKAPSSEREKGEVKEIKMKNFYSMTGINFKNIAENDVQITEMLNKMTNKGWQLYKVVSGMDGGNDDGNGLFITRYIFVRIIPTNQNAEKTH